MNAGCEKVAHIPKECDSLLERLCGFMRANNLTKEELAGLLRTSPQTLDDWFNDGMPPPASLLALSVLFETLPQAPGCRVSHPWSAGAFHASAPRLTETA
jgi:hypothetical protein